jgi:hypothetical protein
MCAIQAAKQGQRVAVLDHADRIGKKILISGGGRCNFTNLHCKPENFLSANPHFAKSALARYTPADFIMLVEKHNIAYHEKTLGQLFCDRSAQQIVTLLEEECASAGVKKFLNAHVQQVRHTLGFHVVTRDAEFSASALVVATGGLSIPKMGATSLGYDLATQFGLAIQPCRPALVPLTFSTSDLERYGDLAGVATEVLASVGNGPSVGNRQGKQRFREKMLFTHRGVSGPAILQISSYWKPPAPLLLDLAPERTWTAPLLHPNARRDLAAARAALRGILPQRLADRWLQLHPPASWTNHALAQMEQQLHHWSVIPAGTEGYEKAEVTAGGVDTAELSAKTMESKRLRGLFFIGEVVDVTGHLGGFNFQWAWASGYSAGQAFASAPVVA